MSYMNEYGDGGQVSEAMDVVARTGIGYGDHGQISEAADVAARSGIAASSRPAGSEQSARATTGGAMAGESAQRRLAGGSILQAPEGTDVRFEKVAALREAIAAGTYAVSAADLADKLMAAMQESRPAAMGAGDGAEALRESAR